MQDFFASVLEEAHRDPAYRANLLRALVGLELDSKIWLAMYHYTAGTPTRSVKHDAGPSLAALIAGTARDDDEDEGDE